jgi:hypothetical protein
MPKMLFNMGVASFDWPDHISGRAELSRRSGVLRMQAEGKV